MVIIVQQKGEEFPNASSSHVTLPHRKTWTARAMRLWVTVRLSNSSLQNSADPIMVLTGLLEIANSLVIIHTTQTITGLSWAVSYGNHYRANHWALFSLCKWTELDWVSTGSPFYKNKKCGLTALNPPNVPKLSPSRAVWSRFALYIQDDYFGKSLNTGKVK